MLADRGHHIVVRDRRMIIDCVEREFGNTFSYQVKD
jgi:hypothetical protein